MVDNNMNNLGSRVHTIDTGRVMVVTDLHGDWDLYRQYRDAFLKLRDQDQAHTFVLTGDYIHSDEPEEFDQSLAIVLDLLRLKACLGSRPRRLIGQP